MKTFSVLGFRLVAVGLCAFTLAFLGCRPSGHKQAGGERTSAGDVAAGDTTSPVPPNNEEGIGTGGLPPPPLNTQQLVGDLDAASFDQKQTVIGRVDEALRIFDANLRPIEGFGLEVDRPNGERGLPQPAQRLRNELQSARDALVGADASQWSAAKQRLTQAWRALETEFNQRKPATRPVAHHD